MPTEKIDEVPKFKVCVHPEHNPPMFQVFEPGKYKHTCPECKYVQYFVVQPKICLNIGNHKGL